jgi:hypothetical protein
MADDKAGAGPEVLPALAADKTVAGPEVLPAMADDKTVAGPEVLPGAPEDKGAHDGPQILPGADDEFLVRDWLTAADIAPRDGYIEQTLPIYADLPADDGYLFVATDGGAPQVLPAMDDGFILTGKFNDVPPVMPSLNGDFDGGLSLTTEMELAREFLMTMAREHPLNLRVSGESLTLTDDWSGIVSPPKDDIWG